jgi:NADPH:quinone reductase-like Zn-dependent oxidoreductase
MASEKTHPCAGGSSHEMPVPQVMKAIRAQARGGPEQLVYDYAPVPKLSPDDVLVRVHATGITPAELTWGATYQNPDGSDRLPSTPGHEVSGLVAALAPNVTGLRVGDAVYGLCDFARDGAAAEYGAVRAVNLAPKPRTLNHEQTAAVPLSALTAWQALFRHGGLEQGARVLIHGGAGGVGTFAVQLARWRGAQIFTTASRRNREFLRHLGAHEVIDYTTERFDEKLRDVDLVLDTIGGETQERSWKVLRRDGVLIALTAPVPPAKPEQYGVRAIFFIVEPSRDDLIEITRLLDSGTLEPIVAEVLPLARAREAFENGLQGHTRGKIVLHVRD